MNYFLCDCCSDYLCDTDDYIRCDCGKRWCSVRCAKIHGYLNRKTLSSCGFCRKEKDDNDFLQNFLRIFILDLIKVS